MCINPPSHHRPPACLLARTCRSVKANAGSAKTGTGYSWLPGADTPEYLATLPG